MEYVQMAMDNPAFGAAYYPVVWGKSDGTQVELILAVNCSGLHLLYRRSREFFKSFYYETIMKWGRSMATFNFPSQEEQRWEFETEQGEEMNKFIKRSNERLFGTKRARDELAKLSDGDTTASRRRAAKPIRGAPRPVDCQDAAQ